MSTESSQLHNATRAFQELAALQLGQVIAFYGELAKWNERQSAQTEAFMAEWQKLTKEAFAHAADLGAEARRSHHAAAKKGLSLWGGFA